MLATIDQGGDDLFRVRVNVFSKLYNAVLYNSSQSWVLARGNFILHSTVRFCVLRVFPNTVGLWSRVLSTWLTLTLRCLCLPRNFPGRPLLGMAPAGGEMSNIECCAFYHHRARYQSLNIEDCNLPNLQVVIDVIDISGKSRAGECNILITHPPQFLIVRSGAVNPEIFIHSLVF